MTRSSFRFSMNAYGYDVIWRDSARYLGFVARYSDGWKATLPGSRTIGQVFNTRNDAAWALFKGAD